MDSSELTKIHNSRVLFADYTLRHSELENPTLPKGRIIPRPVQGCSPNGSSSPDYCQWKANVHIGAVYTTPAQKQAIIQTEFPTSRPIAPPVPPVPLVTSTLLWLDMSDPSAYSLDLAGNISTIVDKSGNGYTMNVIPPDSTLPGFTSILPVPGTAIHGLTTAYFSGPAGIRQPIQLNGVTDFFWVGRQYEQISFGNPVASFFLGDSLDYTDWSGDSYHYIYSDYSQPGIARASTTLFYNGISTTQAFSDISILPTGTIFMISAHGITGNTRFDGICYDRQYNEGWIGDFGETICFNTPLTVPQISTIEGELLTKWGL